MFTEIEILERINEIRWTYADALKLGTLTEKDVQGYSFELENLSYEYIYYYLRPLSVALNEAEDVLKDQEAKAHGRSRAAHKEEFKSKAIDVARKEWMKDPKYRKALLDYSTKKEHYWRMKMLMDKIDRICNKMKYIGA